MVIIVIIFFGVPRQDAMTFPQQSHLYVVVIVVLVRETDHTHLVELRKYSGFHQVKHDIFSEPHLPKPGTKVPQQLVEPGLLPAFA